MHNPCRSTRMNASWRGRGFSNRAYFDDERVNGLWRRRVTDKTTAADRSIVKINTLFGHCSTPPRSIICSVVRVTGDHTGPRYAATFPQHARLCWPIAGLDDKASLEYFSRPRLASKILSAMRARSLRSPLDPPPLEGWGGVGWDWNAPGREGSRADER